MKSSQILSPRGVRSDEPRSVKETSLKSVDHHGELVRVSVLAWRGTGQSTDEIDKGFGDACSPKSLSPFVNPKSIRPAGPGKRSPGPSANDGARMLPERDVLAPLAKEKTGNTLVRQRMFGGFMTDIATGANQNVYCWPNAARRWHARGVSSKRFGLHRGGHSKTVHGTSLIARIATRVWQRDCRISCAMIRDQFGASETQPHCVPPGWSR
jgi:hypothetical protein